MKTFAMFTFMAFTAISFSSCRKESPVDGIQWFDLRKIAAENPGIVIIEKGEGFEGQVLRIRPNTDNQQVTIWDPASDPGWTDAEYLVCEMWHDNAFSAVVNIDFYAGRKPTKEGSGQRGEDPSSETPRPRLTPKIGILPRIKTKLVFPLEHLDGQNIFMRRFPRQLKGTVLGSRMEKREIDRVVLRFAPYKEPYFTPEFEIASIFLTETEPETYPEIDTPVVDPFGQWVVKDWPGKTRSESELIQTQTFLLADAEQAEYPEEWSRFGGWENLKFQATGYFRTHHDGRRWWLVDPDGYAFISNGVDCIGPNASGVVENQEDLFAWLPERDDELFGRAVSGRGGAAMVDFYRTNLIRVFGADWLGRWTTITQGLMKHMKFNTVGNWSSIEFAKSAKLPYVLPLRGFPSTEINLFRDFPDVFSEEYKNACVTFAAQLEPYKNDPYLIGYFLRNEPQWAFGFHNLAFEMFATIQSSATKSAFVDWIAYRYRNDLQAFNAVWGLGLDRFGELEQKTFREIPSETAGKDFYAFTELMVEEYVGRPCDEVEKIDPNHLNLGMRYAWISSDLLYKAGERFDVFSINGYGNPGPPKTEEISRRSGKPVMIGEFHFGSTDRGLPATGIQGALNQVERGKAYRYYVEQGYVRPELIGIHYFQWIDQPVFGRFDGENYNIGIVDICNRPYEEFTRAVTLTNGRIYEIAVGVAKPFDQVIDRLPPVHY